MKYNEDYYINKYEAIPERLWCTGDYDDGDKHCALGHCRTNGQLGMNGDEIDCIEVLFVENLGTSVAEVNDGIDKIFNQLTPKQRILAALYEIKQRIALKEAKSIINHSEIHASLNAVSE